MSMTIEEAVAFIHSRLPFGSKPGLTRVEALLNRRGNPENTVPTIHIAGTNGKGSTVTDLRCMLEEVGLIVGTFTSPYIESFNERIAINGKPIADEHLIHYVTIYREILKEMDQDQEVAGITEFELITALALDYFDDQKVDVAIIEVGLGGLLDSTNVVKPMLTAITTIGMDHMDLLGNTLVEIAAQKAGIIKKEVPVVTGNISLQPLEVIQKKAQSQKSPIYRYGKEFCSEYLHTGANWGEVFTFYGEMGKLSKITTSLLGVHQVENAAVAIQLFYLYCQKKQINFRSKYVYEGLKKATWPARMERISQEPLIILDGAHNVHAMERLVDTLQKEFKGKKIIVLFSALDTKDIEAMLHLLQKISTIHIYVTTFDFPHALDLSKITHLLDKKTEVVSLWQFGLGEILADMSSEEVLLITGSLYFVAQVRELLTKLGGNNENN